MVTGKMFRGILLSVACSSGTFAASSPGVRWSCERDDHCQVAALDRKGSPFPVYNGVVRSPQSTALNFHLYEFRMSCGSPCHVSFFVDIDGHQVSEPFQNVIAMDAGRRWVAVAEQDHLRVQPMFHPEPSARIQRPFPPAAALVTVIRSAAFTPEGSLKLRYQRAPDFAEVEEDVPVDWRSSKDRR